MTAVKRIIAAEASSAGHQTNRIATFGRTRGIINPFKFKHNNEWFTVGILAPANRQFTVDGLLALGALGPPMERLSTPADGITYIARALSAARRFIFVRSKDIFGLELLSFTDIDHDAAITITPV